MPAEESYAYLASRYPAVTHTFIADEVRAHREAGVRIETAAIRSEPGQVLSEAYEQERRVTRYLVPVTPWGLAGDHLHAFAHAPLAYVRTFARALGLATGGARASLWQAFYFAEAIMLWRWLARNDIRHVHVHFPNVASDVALLATSFANAARAGRAERWTWSMTLHGPTEFADVTTHKLPAKVAHAAAVICTSAWARSQVIACSEPVHRDKAVVVHSGVDTALFAPAQRTRTEGPVRVLNVAALSVRKGHRDLLAAHAALRARGHDVFLTIVGDGPERAGLEAEAVRLGIDGSVAFAGALSHEAVRAHYAEADIFCLPSYAEGVPTVLIEAMACEVPVVATHINGTPELVQDGEAGLLVPPARPDALADALERLVRDPLLREAFGAAGRRRVLERFELHGAARAVREVFRSVRARAG